MKKGIELFKKNNQSKIIQKNKLHYIFGGDNSDNGKKAIFIYHPNGAPTNNN
ncbi:hypothetical protein [Tenacibaculum sp. 190524A05c]|uniref:hypothetical protein n=1 Tax=Tenacibaculum platacis TaxID=3137852 RepID=UPI0032B1A7C3